MEMVLTKESRKTVKRLAAVKEKVKKISEHNWPLRDEHGLAICLSPFRAPVCCLQRKTCWQNSSVSFCWKELIAKYKPQSGNVLMTQQAFFTHPGSGFYVRYTFCVISPCSVGLSLLKENQLWWKNYRCCIVRQFVWAFLIFYWRVNDVSGTDFQLHLYFLI